MALSPEEREYFRRYFEFVVEEFFHRYKCRHCDYEHGLALMVVLHERDVHG